LSKLDFTGNKKYETVRDLFLIGCYTGMAYVDYSDIKKEHISGDFLKYKRQKTGVQVTLYIKPELRTILEKYNYHLPKSYSNQKTNEYLKEIGKLVPELKLMIEHSQTVGGKTVHTIVPKYTLLTSHTGRRSYATNEYLFETPVQSIMATTGHKTEKSFMKYIRLSSNEHAKVVQLHHQTKVNILKRV
jgi:integrase